MGSERSSWVESMEVAYDNKELMAGFQILEGHNPFCKIAFGYPAEKPEAHDKKSPLET